MCTYISMNVCTYVSIYPSTYLCVIIIIISLLHTGQRPLGTHRQLKLCVLVPLPIRETIQCGGLGKGCWRDSSSDQTLCWDFECLVKLNQVLLGNWDNCTTWYHPKLYLGCRRNQVSLLAKGTAVTDTSWKRTVFDHSCALFRCDCFIGAQT